MNIVVCRIERFWIFFQVIQPFSIIITIFVLIELHTAQPFLQGLKKTKKNYFF